MINIVKLTDYSSVIYVDENLGDDTNGSGTEISPYKSITKARSMVSVDNTLIYLKKGNYTITSLSSMLHNSLKLTYITETSLSNENIVNVTITSTLSTNFAMSAPNTLIGIVFLRGAGGDGRVFEYFFDSSNLNIEFRNCVFDNEKSPSPATNDFIFTGNSNGCTVTKLDYRNCVFINVKGKVTGTKVSKGYSYDSMATSELFSSGASSNFLFTTDYNKDNYSLGEILNENYGVYSGDTAWDYKFKKIFIKSNNRIYSFKLEEILYETKMTSNYAPSPYVASASSVYSTTQYLPFGAFDGKALDLNSAMWMSKDNELKNSWLKIDMGKNICVNEVYLTPRDSANINQAPKDFYIESSVDDVNWIKIGEFSVTDWVAFTSKRFYLKQTVGRYFRITHLTSNGATRVSWSEVLFGQHSLIPTELKKANKSNFINHGLGSIALIDCIAESKNYILQDSVSENADGLWVQEIDRKPLSIKFE